MGHVRRGRYRYSVRTQGELEDVGEIGEIEVRPSAAGSGGGTGSGGAGSGSGASAGISGSGGGAAFIPLRELATVTDGFQERESEARYDGQAAVGLLVFKESGANTVRVAKQVDGVLAQLRAKYPAIRLEVATSQAGFVSSAIANVVQALLLGGALAFLVLILFLRDVRYPIAIALAIPISVVVTFALLDAAGISLNVMTLGGLALGVGMLVDNSIVVLENVFRHREQGGEAVESAARGAEEVQGAITASTLTTIAVFGPIAYVEGVAGELFGALSLAVAFSLLASLLVALTLLPTMAARWKGDVAASSGRRRGLLRGPLEAFDRGFERFTAFYEATLARALRRPGRVAALSVALLVIAVAVGLGLRRDVLPHVDQGEFDVRLDLPRGTPLERTAEAATRIEAVLRADPAVADVFTRVGRQAAVQGFEDEETGLNTALVAVRLKQGEKTAPALARIRPKLAGFPPGAIAIETGTATALGRLLGGSDADLAVQVRGEDLDAALAYAREVEGRLDGLPRLGNVRLGTELGQPEVRVEIDRERAASYGIDPREISDAIRGAMQGTVATQLADFDRRVPIVVRLPDAQRRSLASLASLRVNGVPLRELVRTVEAAAPTEIRRVDQNRQVSVLADVVSGGVAAATADVENALAALPPPRGLRAVVGGENEELRQGFRALGFAFLLAMLLVYMILAAQFESLLHPFVVLLTVPLGVMGALLALGLTGSGLNTLSLIGIVVLVGIGVNDAVVKVDFINQMRRQGMAVREAVLAAGHARLRPIVMTTLTTLLGVLPMALGLGRGGELQRPLAIAVFGGLTATTALTLIVIPVAYEAVENSRLRLQALTGVDLAAGGWVRRLLPWRRAEAPSLAVEAAARHRDAAE